MPELFTQTEVDFGGAMHAKLGVVVSNKGLSGVLLQNIGLNYSQQVTRIYELGIIGQKTKVYYIGGRAQGMLSANRVVGPGSAMKQYYETFSDICQAGQNTIALDFNQNICGIGGSLNGIKPRAKYTSKFCTLMTIGVTQGAQDFVINESSQLMFSGLEFEGT
jgi:hypothetical protein